jgi:hypothetical protein
MICEVFQVNDNPDHLLLVTLDGEVINGFWHINNADKYGLKITMLGYIEWPWKNESDNEDYNITLARFRDGERAAVETCPTCGHKEWKSK